MHFAWIFIVDVPEIIFLAEAETKEEFLQLAKTSEQIKDRYYEDYQEFKMLEIFKGSFEDYIRDYLPKEENIHIVPYMG